MRRRDALVPLLALAATALFGPGLAGARTPAPGCAPAGAHVIARGAILRVYTTPSAGSTVYACLRGRHTRMTLLAAGAHHSLAVMASSGPLVAFTVTSFGVDAGSVALRVADVQARRVIRELPVGHYIDAGFVGYERVEKVVLGPEGGVGWIAAMGQSGHGAPDYAVHDAATVGEPRLLDEGPDIGPDTLSIAFRTLHWWHAGIEHSALLP